MGSFLRDLRYALRMSAKSPAFTSVAVLTLALGMAATVASFSLFEAVEWNWLQYPDLDQLVVLGKAELRAPTYYRGLSGPDFLAVKQQSHSYSAIAAQESKDYQSLTGNGEPQSVYVGANSANLFSMMGVKAALGRLFTAEDERAANSAVAVLTNEEWRTHFGGNPSVIGKTIMLDGEPKTIIGVLPGSYRSNSADVYVPLMVDSPDFLDPQRAQITAVGHLARGVSVTQAKVELDGIIARLAKDDPAHNKDHKGWLRSAREFNGTEYYERRTYLFLAVAGLVLITACVNVANLLLARSVERQTEFAVRSALGAGRWVLVRQLLAESLLLACAGAAAGGLLAKWGIHALTAFASPAAAEVIPQAAVLTVDIRAVAVAVGVALIAALLFGTAPAFVASRVDPERWLKAGGRSQTGSRTRQRLRDSLVLAEVALAFVLTFAGGLFARSLRNLERADLGFNPDHLLSATLWPRGARYATPAAVAQFYDALLQKSRAIPGVKAAAIADRLPMTSGRSIDFTVVGGAPAHPTGLLNRGAVERAVSADYFQFIGIPIVRGRGITAQDTAASTRVVVINQNLAHRYFGEVDPIGHELNMKLEKDDGRAQNVIAEIVGIARNVREVGVNEADFDSIYLPFAQQPKGEAFLAVRTMADAKEISAAIRREIAALDPNLPVLRIATMDERIRQALAGDRFNTTAVTVLSAVALLLALVGIYAVLGYTVSQRVHEIGIRVALGATSRDVLGWIVGRSGRLVVTAVAGGVAASLVIGKLLGDALYLVPTKHEGMLYGVTLHDPLTLVAAGALLTATALAASYFPARRATKVDPMEALRAE